MALKQSSISLIFFISSFLLISSQRNTIYPTNKIIEYCSKNVYHFEFDINTSQKLDKIIPLVLKAQLPHNLPFKCVIDGTRNKFSCFHSFSNYVWSLPSNSKIELPYIFPYINDIRWDYDLFLKNIYRNL